MALRLKSFLVSTLNLKNNHLAFAVSGSITFCDDIELLGCPDRLINMRGLFTSEM